MQSLQTWSIISVKILHWLYETTVVYYYWKNEIKWVRMPSQMSRIHKMVTRILSPPTIWIEKKLTEFISIEIRNCSYTRTRMLICRRGMGRLSDTCERCDARTALGQQHQHGFGQCPPPPLLPPFKNNFFIRCSSMKTLYNCVPSPDKQGTKSRTF